MKIFFLDLTVQHIRDDVCVHIQEQIARFFIMSRHLLCENDPHFAKFYNTQCTETFDENQNNKLLSDVLKTLSEVYTDIGKPCPNEAEFRSYHILSVLKTPALNQVVDMCLRLPAAIRLQPPLKFALDIAFAFRSNNYVAFFKLIKERATYLQSCLLHACFNVMRDRAFHLFRKAYSSAGVPYVFWVVIPYCFPSHERMQLVQRRPHALVRIGRRTRRAHEFLRHFKNQRQVDF